MNRPPAARLRSHARRAAGGLVLVVALLACSRGDECRDCTITAELLTAFGASDGDGALASTPWLGPGIDGERVVLQPDVSGELPRLFTERGRFLRTIGESGDGPGEFRGVDHVMRSADSLFFFDVRARRLVVMQMPDRVVRTATWMSHTYGAIELANGTIVSTDAVWVPGRPFEHLTRTGELLQRFGDSLPAHARARIVARAPDGSFWAAPRTRRLEFEHWATPAHRLETVEVVTPHYAPYDVYAFPADDRPPSPSLRGFWVDSLSHLWLVLEVPGAEWRAGFGEPRRGEGGVEFLPTTDRELAWASVIMEYDPVAHRVVAERRFEEAFLQVVGPGLVTRVLQDEDGWHRVQLYRIAPASPSSTGRQPR